MPTRRYDQVLRADAADRTRRRILDGLGDQLRARPTEPVSMDALARSCRVARSTIYTIFGSRSGLFAAFVDDLFERSGLAELTEAVARSDARIHLREGVAAANRMYARDRGIYRVLFSLAKIDPDGVGAAARQKEANRLGGMQYLARRLAEDGALRADISVEHAVQVLWVVCSFDTFDALYCERGLSVDEATDRIVAMAERALCVDPS